MYTLIFQMSVFDQIKQFIIQNIAFILHELGQ